MDETQPIGEEASPADYSTASAEAIEMPAVALSLREPSPLQPLLIWLGPPLAIANLGLFPSFAGVAILIVASIFASRGTRPPGIGWLPLLIVLTLLLAGLVPAQAFLATLCFTWSQGNYWRRFLQHWLVVLAIASTILGGAALFAIVMAFCNDSGASRPWYGTPEERRPMILGILAVLASLPMVLLAVQLPFWFARHFWGCRLVKGIGPLSQSSAATREPLALRDLFMATALVAVSLGLLQFADHVNAEQGNAERAYLFASLIFGTICGCVSLIGAFPLTVLFFRCRSLWFAWGVALATAGIDALLVFAIAESLNRTPNPWQSLVVLVGLIYSFTCGSAAGLTILRRDDWRMVSRWSGAHG